MHSSKCPIPHCPLTAYSPDKRRLFSLLASHMERRHAGLVRDPESIEAEERPDLQGRLVFHEPDLDALFGVSTDPQSGAVKITIPPGP